MNNKFYKNNVIVVYTTVKLPNGELAYPPFTLKDYMVKTYSDDSYTFLEFFKKDGGLI